MTAHASGTAGRSRVRSLERDDNPSVADLDLLDAKQDAALLAETGHRGARPLAVVLRAGGKIVAGVRGETRGNCCELTTLWVDDAYRGQGVASQLLCDAEAEARRRGCEQVLFLSQAPTPVVLYPGLGYDVVGYVPDCPPGTSAYWLRKWLHGGAS